MAITVGNGITIGSGIILGGTVPPISYPRLMGVDSGWNRLIYNDNLIIGIGADATGPEETANTNNLGQNWTAVSLNIDAYGIAYGNGVYAVVGIGTVFKYSTTGTSWTSSPTAVDDLVWTGVAYGNGVFVAVGQTRLGFATDKYAYSSDGINWTSSTLPQSAEWEDIVFGNGQFVAVSQTGGIVAISSNGISWATYSGIGLGNSVQQVTYGNGYYVAVRTSGAISYSTTGTSWTSKTAGISGISYYGIGYGNGKFVIAGGDNKIRWATNPGESWYSANLPGPINYTAGGNPATPTWLGITYSTGSTPGWLITGYYYPPDGVGPIKGLCATSSDAVIWY